MYGLGGLFVHAAFLPQFCIEDTKIAERDIGGNDIEFRVFKVLPVYRLESCCPCNCVFMQEREYQSRNEVFLNGIVIRAGHGNR